MPYLLQRYDSAASDPVFPITVDDDTINTETDLGYVGISYESYAQIVAQNFVYLCENFKSPIAPPTPISGQIWYSSTDRVLRFWDGIKWRIIGTYVSNLAPSDASSGDLWFDGDKLYAWNGTTWVIIGPQGDSTNYTDYETINGVGILRIVIGNKTVAIFSSGTIPFSFLGNNPAPLDDQINFPNGIDFGLNVGNGIGSLGTIFKLNNTPLVTNPKTVNFSGAGVSVNAMGKDLFVNFSGSGGGSGGGGINVLNSTTITTSGNYTVPNGISKILVKIYGAGGAGAPYNIAQDGTNGTTTTFTNIIGPTVNIIVPGGIGALSGLNTPNTRSLNNGRLGTTATGADFTILGEGAKGGKGGMPGFGDGSGQPSSPGGDGSYAEKLLQVSSGDTFAISLGTGGQNANPDIGYYGENAYVVISEYGEEDIKNVVFANAYINYMTPGSYVFTVPQGVYQIKAQVWGAGAAGRDGTFPAAQGGGSGGGSGAYGYKLLDVYPGQLIPLTVGAGGTPSSSNLQGGDSVFNNVYIASGGQPRNIYLNNASGGYYTPNFDYGIKGQEGQISTADLVNSGYGGTAPNGGMGAVLGSNISTAPGGGGLGARGGETGGAGSNGKISIEYTYPRYIFKNTFHFGFSAFYDKSIIGADATYNPDSGVIMPIVDYDNTSSYNNTTGYFTIPKDGIYQFNGYVQYSFDPGETNNFEATSNISILGSRILVRNFQLIPNNSVALDLDLSLNGSFQCTEGQQIALVTNQVSNLTQARLNCFYVKELLSGELIYSIPGTYTFIVPSNVTSISIEIWGAAAGSASLFGGSSCSGGYSKKVLAVTPGSSHTVIVGAGSAGMTYPHPAGGFPGTNPGGDSSFDGTYIATGSTGAGPNAGSPGNGINGDINTQGGFGIDLGGTPGETANGGNAPLGGLGGTGSHFDGFNPGGGAYADAVGNFGKGGDGQVKINW